MVRQSPNQYDPVDVSLPGETLLETIQAMGMTQADLAERTGRSRKTINEIIKGKEAISPDTALQLERVLGVPASFWNNRERNYREARARRGEAERLQHETRRLDDFPVTDMLRLGWIRPAADPVRRIQELLNFFGIASPEQFGAVLQPSGVAFRQSASFRKHPGSVAVWLRKGQIEAQAMACKPYEQDRFRGTLSETRALTRKPPDQFVGGLQVLCAAAGVAVVFVPELPDTGISGATRWLSPVKALLQLSLRYKTDDQLWFSFFHEAGHIVLHGKRDIFLENPGEDGEKENQANAFAAEMLIPRSALEKFLSSTPVLSKRGIRNFAESLGIAPGIVVGRLQHDGNLRFDFCNDLKQRFEWSKG